MQTLKRNERLKKKQIIQDLFNFGESFHIYPVRVIWKEYENDFISPAQVLFSVPKKRLRRAVDRNKIKRLLREAYRKNNKELYKFLNKSGKKCALALVYTANEILPYIEIEKRIISVLERLILDYEKTLS